MKRLYSISKELSEENKQNILETMNSLDDVTDAEITEEGFILETGSGDYTQAGNLAVNAFARNGGAEISFRRFVYDD